MMFRTSEIVEGLWEEGNKIFVECREFREDMRVKEIKATADFEE